MRRFIAIILAATAPSALASCKPTQIHLAGGVPSDVTMTVSWLTSSPDCVTSVHVGTDEYNLNRTATSTTPPLNYTYDTQKFGSYTSAYIHHVTVVDLEPKTTYFYVPGGGSNTHSFTTQKTAQVDFSDYPVTFGVIGDLGQTSNSNFTVGHVVENDFAAIIHAGDMSYADGDQTRWDSYFEMIEYAAAYNPWYVAAGNHEIEINDNTYEVFTAYDQRYKMPYVCERERPRGRSARENQMNQRRSKFCDAFRIALNKVRRKVIKIYTCLREEAWLLSTENV